MHIFSLFLYPLIKVRNSCKWMTQGIGTLKKMLTMTRHDKSFKYLATPINIYKIARKGSYFTLYTVFLFFFFFLLLLLLDSKGNNES